MTDTPPEPLGLYVHIPFCEVKCAYCHFAIDPGSGHGEQDRQERYTTALLAEMTSAALSLPSESASDTLYIGGGTPSLLTVARLARIVGTASSLFHLSPSAEITLEANPRDLDADGYRNLRTLGVNRLSLGIQSFDDGVLTEMGRLHTADDARRAAAQARAADFDNVSVDLTDRGVLLSNEVFRAFV